MQKQKRRIVHNPNKYDDATVAFMAYEMARITAVWTFLSVRKHQLFMFISLGLISAERANEKWTRIRDWAFDSLDDDENT